MAKNKYNTKSKKFLKEEQNKYFEGWMKKDLN